MNWARNCSRQDVGNVLDLYLKVQNDLNLERKKRLEIVESLQLKTYNERLALVENNLMLKSESEEILEISNGRLKNIFVLTFIGVLILIIVLIAWYFRFKKGQKKRKRYFDLQKTLIAEKENSTLLNAQIANAELENKKLEMSNLLSSADSNTILFEELELRLNALRMKDGDIKDDLGQLLQFVKSQLKSEEINILIEENTDLYSHKFKEKVEALYTDLTPSEFQLIVLIRLDLSNKDMAQLKNVEPSSIRIYKSRLKQKLKLASEVNLVQFIRSL